MSACLRTAECLLCLLRSYSLEGSAESVLLLTVLSAFKQQMLELSLLFTESPEFPN